MDNIKPFLDYGAFGLLALMMLGVGWYVRNAEAQRVKRDEDERERRRQLDADAKDRADRREVAEERRQAQWLAAYTKATEAHVSATATLAIVIAEFKSHDARMQEEHRAIIDNCGEFGRQGIGEQ